MFSVTSTNPAALEAAIRSANAMAFLTTPQSTVVIELASSLIGQSIVLTQVLPVLVVDYVTVRVQGAGPNSRVTIDASNVTTAFRVNSHHALLQNLRFHNLYVPATEYDVVSASGADDLTFANCDFDSATGNCLWLIGTTHATVQDCNITNGAGGFAATAGSSDVTITRCTFTDNGRAITLLGGNRIQINNSTFARNYNALVMQPVCADVTFGPGNNVSSTAQTAVSVNGSLNFQVQGNQFTDNQGEVIHLGDLCVATTISGCSLLRNGVAGGFSQVMVQDCVGVQVSNLQCSSGGAGLYASHSQLLRVLGAPGAPTTISGNGHEALTFDSCTDVGVDQVSVTGNLAAAGGAQVTVRGCSGVDIANSSITGAPGGNCIGLFLSQSDTLRVGLGTVVQDHGQQGVLVDHCADLTLGNWAPGTGSLSVRGQLPLYIGNSQNVQVRGTPTYPCTIQAGPVTAGSAVSITGNSSGTFGPCIGIDGAGTALVGLQIVGGSWHVDAAGIGGHSGWGIVAAGAAGLQVTNCSIDGGPQQAANEGILLNPGCDGAQLFGNLVTRQLGTAFNVVDSDNVLIGPGNRAIDNAGDGFTVSDSGTGALTRTVTIQSSVAVGRLLAGQSGFHCSHMLGALTNVTATRQGIGVRLSRAGSATMVNAISWGNTVDRFRDSASSGTWRNGLLATSAGGSWTEQDMVIGQDPQFVSAQTGDVRLLAGSPAIDSGLHTTPAGCSLPCADAALLPRIRGGTIDRGAYEYQNPAGNSLDILGPWLRVPSQSVLGFTVQRTAAQAGQLFLLLCSGSGTGPGLVAPGGGVAPLVPDFYTNLLRSAPAWCIGQLDGGGSGSITLPLPPAVLPFLPELTFAAVFSSAGASTNPVIVRFLQ